MIQVKIDLTGTLQFLQIHLPRAIDAATVRGLDRTAVSARKSAMKEIREKTGLPPKFLRERLTIKRASVGNLTAEIRAAKGAPNLARFNARQVKAGVSANAWNVRKVYKGAFLGNGGRTAFARTSKARLPLKPLRGPSVPKAFMQDAAQRAIAEAVAAEFPKHFASALQGQLARYRSRGSSGRP